MERAHEAGEASRIEGCGTPDPGPLQYSSRTQTVVTAPAEGAFEIGKNLYRWQQKFTNSAEN